MNELEHHKEVARHLKRKYPKTIFRTDYGAGLKLTVGQARTQARLQQGRAYPDLFIAEPIGEYHGLYIELKTPDTQLKRTKPSRKILKGDSDIRKPGDWWDKHIQEQAETLQKLAQKGYASCFALGHLHAKGIIDDYMSGGEIGFSSEVEVDESIPEDDSPF